MLYRIYLLVGHLSFAQRVLNIHQQSDFTTCSTHYRVALNLIIDLPCALDKNWSF